jgi:hypothetical protein
MVHSVSVPKYLTLDIHGDHLDIEGKSVNLEQAVSAEKGSGKLTATLISLPLLLCAVDASYEEVSVAPLGICEDMMSIEESWISSMLSPYRALDIDGTLREPSELTYDPNAGIKVSLPSIENVPRPCGYVFAFEGIWSDI